VSLSALSRREHTLLLRDTRDCTPSTNTHCIRPAFFTSLYLGQTKATGKNSDFGVATHCICILNFLKVTTSAGVQGRARESDGHILDEKRAAGKEKNAAQARLVLAYGGAGLPDTIKLSGR
jgi:hypothetical protein